MARVYNKYTHMTGSFFSFFWALSSTFCCYHCCCLLWKWARAFLRIFCTVTLTKITSDITRASGWARLLVSTFFPPLIAMPTLLRFCHLKGRLNLKEELFRLSSFPGQKECQERAISLESPWRKISLWPSYNYIQNFGT